MRRKPNASDGRRAANSGATANGNVYPYSAACNAQRDINGQPDADACAFSHGDGNAQRHDYGDTNIDTHQHANDYTDHATAAR